MSRKPHLINVKGKIILQTSVNPNFTPKLNALNRDFVEIKRISC